MKKSLLYTMVAALLGIVCLAGCKDDETYAEQKEKERAAIARFLDRNPLVLRNLEGDILLSTPQIKVISEEQFEAQGFKTNVDENEYVLFSNTGIYMQIVREGVGEKIKQGESKEVVCRHWEYNIIGDSLQTADNVLYWSTTPDIMDVHNNSGTIVASFNIAINGGGSMYQTYKSTAVPAGWIVPLSYVRLGRQVDEDNGIAKVRLIVPHSQGHSDATNNVYPCFYEITYQELR